MGTTNIWSTGIVVEALRKDNYEIWEDCIKCYLVGQDLWEVVEDDTQPPNEEGEGRMKEWRRKNGAALHAIKMSCTPHLLYQIRQKTNAKDAWDTLARLCQRTDKKLDMQLGLNVGTTNICSSTIVVEALRNDNYEIWEDCIKCYLVGQDLWEVVEGSTQPPNEEGNMKEWRRKNAAALHAMKISCTPHLFYQIRQKDNAKDVWDTLANLCQQTLKNSDVQPDFSTSVNPSNFGVPVLVKDNHAMWRGCMKNCLLAHNLWQVVEDKSVAEENEEWRMKNEEALQAIRITCAPDLLVEIKEKTNANDAWDTLAVLCEPPAPQPDLSTTTGVNPRYCGLVTLRKDNYKLWKACMKDFMSDQNLWQVVKNSVAEENEDWEIRNKGALSAIRIQCSPDLLEEIKDKTTAKDAWDTLAALCNSPTSPTAEDLVVERARALTLFKAIHNNDLDFVNYFFKEHPDLISARFELNGKGMALHHATIAETPNIVEELIGKISDEDVKKDDGFGSSALSLAATTTGMKMMRIAERLIRKNKELLTIPDNQGRIPLATACYYGHKSMGYYLYSLTPRQFLASQDGTFQAAMVLRHCIDNNMFDIALDLLRLCPHLTQLTNNSPVLVLSNRPTAFPSGSKLRFWQQWIYSALKVNPSTASNEVNVRSLPSDQHQTEITKIVNQEKLRLGGLNSMLTYFLKFSGIKQIYDLKVTHVNAHQLLLLMSKTISTLDTSQMSQSRLYEAIFNAARMGMTEFIVEVIGANPDLLFATDSYKRDTFQIAVLYRQEKAFNLIYGVGALKDVVSSFCDNNDDSLLHLASYLPPPRMLNQISGAALQMQRELQWFKEVESIVPEAYKGYVNADDRTPCELFEESHRVLVSEGEKWMKEIAQSSTVVGALIITIMFAALYTVPGGNNQDTGIPLLLNEKAFKVFIVSDAISLFASSTSVLMFLGILTSRYAPQDFLKSLPTKLIIALSSLFISIAAMMVAFSATVVIMLKGRLSYIIPIVLLASIPVSLFVWLQFPLLVTIFSSTYGPGIFDRKMRKWLK